MPGAEGSLRDRRRAETIQEIKNAALQQLAEAGPGGMSLRGVARAIGTTVQALYHYFESRNALLSVLVVDAHQALADAIQAAADATRGQPPAERQLAAAAAYRSWALANRPAFMLLYGTPVPGFEPPQETTRAAAIQLAVPFVDTVFDGFGPEQLAAVPLPTASSPLAEIHGKQTGLPPGALVLFVELRARMHGLVMLELLGYLQPVQEHSEALFTGAMERMAGELAALRAG